MKKICLFLMVVSSFWGCDNQGPDSDKPVNNNPPKVEETKLPQKTIPPKITQEFTLDDLTGKVSLKENKQFIKIAGKHASKNGMYMRAEAYDSFVSMFDAAQKEGVNLKIVSATRPFGHQKSIWEAKWNGSRKVDGKDLSKTIKDPKTRALKILEYSSMPGTSRHHWGTDIDLNNLNNDYFEKGEGAKVYAWLTKNAAKYGFCQPYSPKGKERPHGYEEEKWHWSYTPISKQLTYLYKEKIKDGSIAGFKGAETAMEIGVLEKFVLGISKDCN